MSLMSRLAADGLQAPARYCSWVSERAASLATNVECFSKELHPADASSGISAIALNAPPLLALAAALSCISVRDVTLSG